MKGTDIRSRLYELGRKPNKRYGQHFLVDQSVLNAILEAGAVREGDRVLEIGPGLGILTETLIGRGARVTAIEKDRALAAELRERFGEGAEIVEGDAVKIPFSNFHFPISFKLIANIPYNITAEIIRKALWSKETPSIVVLLIQKEVAERAVQGQDGKREAGNGKRGLNNNGAMKQWSNKAIQQPNNTATKRSLLSLSVALASRSARIVRKVPPKCFYPAPSVDSAVLKIEPMTHEERLARWGVEPEKILALAARAFANPRKKLTTTIAGNGISKERLAEALVSVGAAEGARPEELSVEQWAGMTRGL